MVPLSIGHSFWSQLNQSYYMVTSLEVLQTDYGTACSPDFTELSLLSMKSLKHIFIRKGSFPYVQNMTLDNLNVLMNVYIEEDCFHERDGKLKISHCPKLHVVYIGKGSFTLYSGLTLDGIVLLSVKNVELQQLSILYLGISNTEPAETESTEIVPVNEINSFSNVSHEVFLSMITLVGLF